MKKYIIKSDSFDGTIDVWYDAHGFMCFLNFNCYRGTTEMQKILLTLIPRQIHPQHGTLSLISMFEVEAIA